LAVHLTDMLQVAFGGALIIAWMWLAGGAVAPRASDIERLGIGTCAVLGVAWATMAQPLVGVSLLEHAWVLRVLAVAIVAAGVIARRPRLVPALPDVPVVALIGGACLVVSWPVLWTPTDRFGGGDILWHLGWMRQLAGGLTAPTGIYADTPSGYPWLLHSLGAWFVQALPGGMPYAMTLLELFAAGALGSGMWLVCRELRFGRWTAAWSGAIVVAAGGFGWLWGHGAKAAPIVNHTTLREFGGDLVLSPAPTPSLGLIPPVLPRELAIALVPTVVWAALRADGARSSLGRFAAGGAIGCVVLVGPIGGGFAAVCVAAVAISRRRVPVAEAAGAVAAIALWAGPFLWDVHRYGGVVNTSEITPTSPNALQTAVALGPVLLLGIPGIWLARDPRLGIDRRTGAALGIVGLTGLLLALILDVGTDSIALPALARGLHYLPFASLVLAPPAALALVWGVRRLGPVGIPAAIVAAAVLAASPAEASLWDKRSLAAIRQRTAPLQCFQGKGFGAGDQVMGVGPVAFGLRVFALTGANAVYRGRPRIRFRDIFDHIPTQEQRQAWVQATEDGAPPPPFVHWVIGPRHRGTPPPSWAGEHWPCTIDGHQYVIRSVRQP
jgi:hypothetical protein